jgi:hypothetical protein
MSDEIRLRRSLEESWANEKRLSARIVVLESILRKISALTNDSGMSTAAILARTAFNPDSAEKP